MESKDLRDLVRFAEDGPQHGTVFESAHLWSEVVCLERAQEVGADRGRGLGRPVRVARRPGRGPGRPGRRRLDQWGRSSSPPGPSSRSATRRSSPRWSSWSPRRHRPARRHAVAPPRSGAPRRGRSTARMKARAKLGRLAPSAESNSGKGSPSQSANTVRTPVTHASGPVGTLQWYTRNPATHGSSATHRTPVVANRRADPYRPRARTPVGSEHPEQRYEDGPDQQQEQLVPLHRQRERQPERERPERPERPSAAAPPALRSGSTPPPSTGRRTRCRSRRRAARGAAARRRRRRRSPSRCRARRRSPPRRAPAARRARRTTRSPPGNPGTCCDAAAAGPREPRVVGDERQPRDRHHDHQVDRQPERHAALAGLVPDRSQAPPRAPGP